MTNELDSRIEQLEELSGSQTLGEMLSSRNLDDIRLAIGIIGNHEGDTQAVMPINDLILKMMEASAMCYQRLTEKWLNVGEVAALKSVITNIQELVTRLSIDTWVDPIMLYSQQCLGKRIAEAQQEQANEDELNAAL